MTVEQSRYAVRSVVPIQSPGSAAVGKQEGKEKTPSMVKMSNLSSRHSRAKTHDKPHVEVTWHRQKVKRTTDEKCEEKQTQNKITKNYIK